MSSKMIRIVPVRTPESSSLTGAPKQDNNWGNKFPRFDPVRLISTSRPFRLRLLSDEMKKDVKMKDGKGEELESEQYA